MGNWPTVPTRVTRERCSCAESARKVMSKKGTVEIKLWSSLSTGQQSYNMTLPKGICKDERGNLKKPYIHAVQENGKQKQRYFETLEAAIASLDAYRKAKKALRNAKREALSEKREKDLAVNGENCSHERRVSQALVRRHQEMHNTSYSFVVNDFAKADVAFGYTGQAESDTRATFLATQVKTTPKPMNGTNGYNSGIFWVTRTCRLYVWCRQAVRTRRRGSDTSLTAQRFASAGKNTSASHLAARTISLRCFLTRRWTRS